MRDHGATASQPVQSAASLKREPCKMPEIRQLATLLPTSLRGPVRTLWRKVRGNPELHLLCLLSDPDRLSVDVGANAGDYAVFLARHNKGCVAFEPNPELARRIQETYGAKGIRIHACALSDREDQVTLSIPVVDGVEHSALATIEPGNRVRDLPTRTVVVRCCRLDSFGLEPVGVIKIDAEGHEEAVLQGCEALIERDRPNFLIEAEDRHRPGSVQAIRQILESRGYRGFMLERRKLRPIEEFEPARHQDMANVMLDAVVDGRTYVNNFAFACDPAVVDRLSMLAARAKAL
jgi:FkbM family methyltransferase